jgi:nucleotide-binding universal stress UspA family protein
MTIDKLLTTVKAFIERSRALAAFPANDQRRDQLVYDLEATGVELEAEVQARAEQLDTPGRIRNILVALDDSEQAQWAVDEAVRIAEGLDARITLVNVIDNSPIPAPEYAFDDAIRRPALFEASRTLLNTTADRIPADYLADRIVREGKADKQIVETAYEEQADLIVIGSHARGRLGRFLLGSVAEAVVRHAGCPVLTIGHQRVCAEPEPYEIRTERQPLPVN